LIADRYIRKVCAKIQHGVLNLDVKG